MKTQTDLINRVAGLLGIWEVGQDLSSEDSEQIRGYIDGKFTELAKRQIFYVQDPDCIDDEYLLPLAKIIANAAGPDFGQPYAPDADQREESRLRDIDRGPYAFQTLRTEYI